jgi:hypothetical protein
VFQANGLSAHDARHIEPVDGADSNEYEQEVSFEDHQ